MELVATLDFGGSSVKASVATLEGRTVGRAAVLSETLRPRPFVAEFVPRDWWDAARTALAAALEAARREVPAGEVVAVTATSLRQGFVLVGPEGELGNGILNSDRRGADQLDALRQVGSDALYQLTGHWPAPELTLPKLMHLSGEEPERWRAAQKVLFVHDWALWRLCGETVTEASFASAGQMADVRRRAWAVELLDEVGVGTERLAPIVEAGTVIGHIAEGVPGVRPGTAVVSGGGDTQMAAMACGGLAPSTVTVVAGSSTPVQAAVSEVPDDPLRRPWISTHVRSDLWAAETNAGYGGTMLDWLAKITSRTTAELATQATESEPGARGLTAAVAAPIWSEENWARKAPAAALGFTPAHSLADLARAFLEAHAYAIRSNLEDLERATATHFGRVILTGGAAGSDDFCQLVADVTGRELTASESQDASAASAELARRALGAEAELTAADADLRVLAPRDHDAYQTGYERFLEVSEALQQLPKEAA
jgi:sugar (pentulose or hexulose) kinase